MWAAFRKYIGEFADTGGSATTGTVMAKLNALITDVVNAKKVSDIQVFTESGTWIKPAGVTHVRVTAVGGGAGGGGGFAGTAPGPSMISPSAGIPGNAGGRVTAIVDVSVAISVAITIGQGGNGGNPHGGLMVEHNGSPGEPSTFGSYLAAFGGSGGGSPGGYMGVAPWPASQGGTAGSSPGSPAYNGYGAGGGCGGAFPYNSSTGTFGGKGAPGLVMVECM